MAPSPDQIQRAQALEAEIAKRMNEVKGASGPAEAEPDAARKYMDSASAERTTNNTMRHQYKVLNDAEKANMLKVKDMGLALHDFVASLGSSREISLAKTKVEESVMWAVKHITG